MKKIISHLLVLVFYSLLTVLLTYPQIRHMKQGIYSLSDQLFYAWMIERNTESILQKPLSEFYNASVFYPYENTLSFGDHLLGETFLAFPFYITTHNPVFAENVLILASFVLSAYGMFLLVKHFTNNVWIAVVGGVLFSFSHVRFNQYDHLNIISTEWLPFIFLFLQRYLEKWKVRDLIFLSVFYLLTIFLTVYYLVMVSLAIVIYVGVWIIFTKIKIQTKLKEFSFLLVCLGICVAIIFPTLLPYFEFSREFPQLKRVIQDNIIYSANIMSYFMITRTAVASRIAGLSNLSEADAGLFPGIVVLTGTLFSLLYGLKEKGTKTYILFFSVLSIIFLLLSLGPFLKFTEKVMTSSPLPYYYLYNLLFPLQIMRVPARFAIFAELFLVLLACFGFHFVYKHLIQPKIQWIFLTAIVGVAILETWSVPVPLTLVEIKKDFPQVYFWLKEQPENTTVLELPIPSNVLQNPIKQNYRHAFMQDLSILDRDNVEAYRNYFSLLHGKRIVNGYSAYAPPLYLEVVEKVSRFPEESSILALRESKVDYVVIHMKQYLPDVRERIYDMLDTENNVEVVKQFNDDLVIKIL